MAKPPEHQESVDGQLVETMGNTMPLGVAIRQKRLKIC